ncbi:hypothetical protein [Tindallia californiensis]|uniref:Uncharacterized protein n=1 Tax=Tindallia californiensis TaxID=159292 RepID=A0A1H3NVV3_9FIRM|nr:hypothetical protein [Tindallia californiensis]SDY93027.1 hypothetical protein SAMN05192546_105321 [Tindallia californiensis]
MEKNDRSELIEIYGEPAVKVVSELFLEGMAGAIIPGFTAVISNIKQKRYERNINRLLLELKVQLNDMKLKFDDISEERKIVFSSEFSDMIVDYVSEERDEEKIPYIVNGIKNLINDAKDVDNTALYFDVLKSLRKIDILVLKQYDRNSPEDCESDFQEFLDELSLEYDEYRFIKDKLLRSGLLISSYDKDQKEIYETLLELSKFLKELEKGKAKSVSDKLKKPKIRKNERIRLSQFGRSFIDFFAENPSN